MSGHIGLIISLHVDSIIYSTTDNTSHIVCMVAIFPTVESSSLESQ